MSVSYSKEQRKIAKDEDKQLYTIGFTGRGGKGHLMIQGPCGDKVAKLISKTIEKIADIQTKEAAKQ